MESILIVAKSEAMREMLKVMISSLPGFEITAITPNGSTALKQFRKHCPRLIVADGNLPPADIEQVITQVKAEQPHTKILFLANSTHQEYELRTLGVDQVLHRGIPARQILDDILSLTTANQANGPSAPSG
jgi:DNA-binding NarL/FixJ family response regulator